MLRLCSSFLHFSFRNVYGALSLHACVWLEGVGLRLGLGVVSELGLGSARVGVRIGVRIGLTIGVRVRVRVRAP